jgi:hypothetical protein
MATTGHRQPAGSGCSQPVGRAELSTAFKRATHGLIQTMMSGGVPEQRETQTHPVIGRSPLIPR